MREGLKNTTSSATSTATSIVQSGVLLASNYAFSVSSNAAQVNSPLVKIAQTNVSSTKSPFEIQNDGTGQALLLSGNHSQIYIKEIAAADSDTAAYGQIWVKNSTPNVLMFTDDTGTDWTISGNIPTSYFGSWDTRTNNTVYQAATDGFVIAQNSSFNDYYIYTDGSNPPTTSRVQALGYASSGTGVCPVRKNDYYKVVANSVIVIYWLPVGS